MALSDQALSRLQAWSTICAAVIVPLVIAFFGWQIQSHLSSNSLKKDYVGMAIQILAAPDNKENRALRVWATQILEQNSPIPFSPAVRDSFLEGKFVIVSPIPKNLLMSTMMQAPKQWKPLPRNGEVTNGDLLMNYVENQGLFEQNAITLRYLQQAVRAIAAPEKPSRASTAVTPALPHQMNGPESDTHGIADPSTSTAGH